MGSIGGFLGLELSKGLEYHDQLLRLNTGRNAFEHILRTRKYTHVRLPSYCCDALLEPITKLGLKHKFYNIDERLDPIIDFEMDEGSCLLYVNYFGVKNDTAASLAKDVKNLIIDNSQSFFSRPLENTDTFYSCRKFFGVPDGAYVSMNAGEKTYLPFDTSYNSCTHLLKSVDCGIESGYADFQANEARLAGQEVKQMSVLTQAMMKAAEYTGSQRQRNENFHHLHSRLAEINELKLNFSSVNGPMHYPLLVSNPNLRKQLIGERIYIADFWSSVRAWSAPGAFEYFLSENLVALPVDQRYGIEEMDRIVETIFKLI